MAQGWHCMVVAVGEMKVDHSDGGQWREGREAPRCLPE